MSHIEDAGSHISELVEEFRPFRKKLHAIYKKLPATTCRGKAACCTLIPEMTFLEAVSAIRLLQDMEPEERKRVISLMVRYFLLNPVRIMHCPFLHEARCIIYKDRFLGCRTYGLWSGEFYAKMAARSLDARRQVHAAWEQAGVKLPADIREFRQPYCTDVKVTGSRKPDDRALLKLGRKVAALSEKYSPAMHNMFASTFYMDLSFYLVSEVKGPDAAAQAKFLAVRQAVTEGKTSIAEGIIASVTDQLMQAIA